MTQQGFTGLGIAPRLLELPAFLQFKSPTPIQQKAIPVAIEGKDSVLQEELLTISTIRR